MVMKADETQQRGRAMDEKEKKEELLWQEQSVLIVLNKAGR